MRINIALKLFFGFLIIIFLNVFFFAIVSRLSDLNTIANILKRQNIVRNHFIRTANLHRRRATSRYVYDKLQKPESAAIFQQRSELVLQSIDSVLLQLDTILALDSSVTIRSGSNEGLKELVDAVKYKVRKSNSLYTTTFNELVKFTQTGSGEEAHMRREAADEVLDTADTSLQEGLALTDSLIKAQTAQRIKEIEARVSNVGRLTLAMVAGISIFSIVFGLLFSRLITNSLRKLKESAATIGKGNFDFDPRGYPQDEIGDLAQAFSDMAQDLQRTQEELVKSKRLAAIGEIVASVNHEINNPLMIISGNAQFLQMGMDDYPQEMRDRVQAILEETERISQVTRKLRRIKNPIVEDYTSSGEQMINLDQSSQ
ncbi:MAG: HAMP domain-containing protein [Chitinivibrionales bacterium]|nr:HAMP domain-containing protein [Chitinivibrionales bacterium]MBD3357451.1 HAMP domain-containing protein [Chitinivibrionales bacterium]